jgi:hypothetical protein
LESVNGEFVGICIVGEGVTGAIAMAMMMSYMRLLMMSE